MNTVWTVIHFIAIFIILFKFVENKKLQKSFEEIFGDGWHLKEEANLAQENEQQKRGGEGQSNHSMINGERTKPAKNDQNEEDKNDENEQQRKREIIRKFRDIKKKIKQRKGKQSNKEWIKFELTIAKKLMTNRKYIYEWIRELGMGKKRRKEAKLALMGQYWGMKRNDPKMSDRKIAKALKISERSIYLWKAQFREELGMKMIKRQVTDEQKREIIGAFKAIKKKFMQRKGGRKYSREQWVKMENLLAKKLGTNRCQIYKWIKELGMNQIKMRTNEEKLAIIKEYWEMKRKDPKIGERKIAKRLNIDRTCIRKWKDDHFGGKTAFN